MTRAETQFDVIQSQWLLKVVWLLNILSQTYMIGDPQRCQHDQKDWKIKTHIAVMLDHHVRPAYQ